MCGNMQHTPKEESYPAVFTEKPALDETDDGGNAGLGRVLHSTLLAGVIDITVL